MYNIRFADKEFTKEIKKQFFLPEDRDTEKIYASVEVSTSKEVVMHIHEMEDFTPERTMGTITHETIHYVLTKILSIFTSWKYDAIEWKMIEKWGYRPIINLED